MLNKNNESYPPGLLKGLWMMFTKSHQNAYHTGEVDKDIDTDEDLKK
jgi:hypothetical protein